MAALHGAHGELQGGDAADEDAAEKDPERDHQEEGRAHRYLEKRPPLGGDQPFRFRQRGEQHQPRLGAPGIAEQSDHPQGSPRLRIVEHLTGHARRRPAPAAEDDSPGIDPGGGEIRVDPERRLPRNLRAHDPTVGADGGGELVRDLIVVVAGVLQGERGGARQLRGALADLVLDGSLADAQAQGRGDQQRGRQNGGEEEHELEPKGHPVSL
jgi:hypothetical protein